MPCSSPPSILSSFDPAIHLHSEGEATVEAYGASDDIEALNLHARDITTEKTQQGIVIQHRAWKLNDAFRSEGSDSIGIPQHLHKHFHQQTETYTEEVPPTPCIFTGSRKQKRFHSQPPCFLPHHLLSTCRSWILPQLHILQALRRHKM